MLLEVGDGPTHVRGLGGVGRPVGGLLAELVDHLLRARQDRGVGVAGSLEEQVERRVGRDPVVAGERRRRAATTRSRARTAVSESDGVSDGVSRRCT